MSVKYSLAFLRNPLKQDEMARYYAKAQSSGNLSIEKICKIISHSGTAIRGDILAVSDGLIHEMIEGLSEGMVVELGDFGHFQVQVSSNGADTKKEFNSGNIRKGKIQFRPGPLLKEMLKTLEYEKVDKLPVKVKKNEEKI